ncbi:VanZ family protein [Caloranaerobacter azorensis]|uniref:VanZ family protein n=1 Tax=Caloranaerobacter azorensis TaxID=116090 RepID=A0A6P1YFV0_9FIRM|nr:VanZ family protein [Caloranaerobacter azorensis]QIB27977.1 VanZ family protein [Caloranaerobacter azorensis]
MVIDIDLYTVLILIIPFIIYIIYDIMYIKNRKYIKYFFLTIFFIYFINLLNYTIFPIHINSSIATITQEEFTIFESLKNNTNLIPFNKLDKIDFILNIIMTIPLGVLLPCLVKKLNTKKILIIGLITGLGIEACQALLTFVQGFTFRNININDAIANFIGVYLGYKIFILFFKNVLDIYKHSTKKPPKVINLIINYLLELNPLFF